MQLYKTNGFNGTILYAEKEKIGNKKVFVVVPAADGDAILAGHAVAHGKSVEENLPAIHQAGDEVATPLDRDVIPAFKVGSADKRLDVFLGTAARDELNVAGTNVETNLVGRWAVVVSVLPVHQDDHILVQICPRRNGNLEPAGDR